MGWRDREEYMDGDGGIERSTWRWDGGIERSTWRFAWRDREEYMEVG